MTEITNITSLVEKVKEINELLKGQIWWRGQNDFKWKLDPHIFRSQLNGYDEKSGMRRFIQKAHSRHVSVPSISEMHNWLFLMQHYGLPTRLLDWTESPLIACYFATDRGEDKADGALYALSPYKLNEAQTGLRKLLMPYDTQAVEIIESIFKDNQENVQSIIAIRPAEVDIRLLTQLSAFTLHGHNKSLEELSNSQEYIIKIKIPQNSKKGLREELKHLGIRESNIFPDLWHLAQEIKSVKFKKSVLPSISSHRDSIQGLGESDS
jgi:hypothetical protein